MILLMLNCEEKTHYVAVKKLYSLLKDKIKCSEHFCSLKNLEQNQKNQNLKNIIKKIVNHFHSQNLNQFDNQQ